MRAPSRSSAGEVAEWLKALAWKACIRETVSRVRIPPSPPACFVNGSQRRFFPAKTRDLQYPEVDLCTFHASRSRLEHSLGSHFSSPMYLNAELREMAEERNG